MFAKVVLLKVYDVVGAATDTGLPDEPWVMEYDVIAEPPFDGSDHVTVVVEASYVTDVIAGADGTVRAVACTGVDADPKPSELPVCTTMS